MYIRRFYLFGFYRSETGVLSRLVLSFIRFPGHVGHAYNAKRSFQFTNGECDMHILPRYGYNIVLFLIFYNWDKLGE